MAKHRPENILSESCITLLVGVREIIATRWGCTAQRYEQSVVQAQPVTNVVETDGVGELCVDQADQVAPRAEGASLFVHAGLLRQLRDQIRWDQIANLSHHRELASVRFICCFHSCRVAGQSGFSKL